MKRNENPATEVSIEELIDDIVRVDEKTAVTESVVKQDWPLFEENSVGPFVLIELVAQTAGVCVGWEESILKGKDIKGRLGWLVGIKQARFYLDRIPINSRIRVTSKKDFCLENYQEVVGTAEIGPRVIGEIRLQIVHPDSDEPPT
jgi:predicted hotdog family 3-hydroxylacyl-ACP dehydratase